jgi:transposase
VNDDSATALLGLEGFVVLAHRERDGELELEVETAGRRPACPSCRAVTVAHGRRRVRVRDLPAWGRPVVLVWHKRRWRCRSCRLAFGERHPAVRPRRSTTERLRAEIARQVGQDRRPVSAAAAAAGVGWHTAMAAVEEEAHRRLPPEPAPVRALGLDEHNFSRGRGDRRARWATVVVDAETGRVLAVLDGRDGSALRSWLASRPPAWLAGVEVVCLDPWEPFRSVVRRPGADGLPAPLGRAEVVADPFHVVVAFCDRLNRLRGRLQLERTGRRGRKGDPAWAARRLLVAGAERLRGGAAARLRALLEDPDWAPLAVAWEVKETVRALYRAPDEAGAARLLDRALSICRDSGIPELTSAVRLLTRWREPILAWHRHRIGSARVEATCLNIEGLIRQARGFRNFANYQTRVLLSFGVVWQPVRVARIRGRKPPLIA